MSLALLLALRNLRRAPRRTSLTLAAGAGGLAVAMLLVNLARGIADQAVQDAARLGPGHLVVHRAGYLPFADAEREIAGADALALRIAALPGVWSVAPRLFAPGLARRGHTTRALQIVGVDPEREALTSPLAHRLGAGVFLDGGSPGDVLLGAAISRELGARVGDPISLSVPGVSNGNRERTLRVGGILEPGLDDVAPGAVWAPLALVRELAARPGAAHEIAIFLSVPAAAQLQRVRDRIVTLSPASQELTVATWKEALPQLRDALALDELGRRLLIAALFAIVGIGIAAILLTTVLERSRELGLLLAVGIPPSLLRRMVLAEGAVLGLAAVILGLAAGSLATTALSLSGLDARPFFRDEIAYGGALFSLLIRPAWDWPQTMSAALLLLAVHVAAAAWPAWRAGATAPAEAMRFP